MRRDIASIWDTLEGPVHLRNSRGLVEAFVNRITVQTLPLPHPASLAPQQVLS